MKAKLQCDLVSWSSFYSLSRRLCHRIHDAGYRPELIVAVGRGGYMPARIISDFLHILNLTSFKIEHYSGTQKKTSAVVRYPLARGVAGKKVLLVDDVCDTGDTFELAGRHIMAHLEPEEVRSAVIHFKKTSSFIPDYYAKRMLKWRWIIYPWAAAEDISEFIRQMEPQPQTVEEIRQKLALDYGLRIPLPLLSDMLTLGRP